MIRIVSIVFAVFFGNTAFAERVALVIGNSNYYSAPRFDPAAYDAAEMFRVLHDLEFEVHLGLDLTRGDMLHLLEDFSNRAAQSDLALIYYSGHGGPDDLHRYLMPVDVSHDQADSAAWSGAIPLTQVLSSIEEAQAGIVIFEVGRELSPLAATEAGMARQTENSMIWYSRSPGVFASDASQVQNSVFTEVLAELLLVPDLELIKLSNAVRLDVFSRTGGLQTPWYSSALGADPIVLNDGRRLTPPVRQTISSTRPKPRDSNAQEMRLWRRVVSSRDPSILREYLHRYPNGEFGNEAAAWLKSFDLVGDVGPILPCTIGSWCPRSITSHVMAVRASRVFTAIGLYPPSNFAAYGIVAFRTAPGRDLDRFILFCEAFMAALPTSARLAALGIEPKIQMVTVWPLTERAIAEELNKTQTGQESCERAARHYGQVLARQAIIDAEQAGAKLDGSGPFLLAWAPASLKGKNGSPVLVADLSDVTEYDMAADLFADWAEDIEGDPSLWRESWDDEGVLGWIRDNLDKYGGVIDAAFFGS